MQFFLCSVSDKAVQQAICPVIFTRAQEEQSSKKKAVFLFFAFFHKYVFKDKAESLHFTITLSGLGFIWVAFSRSEAA